MADLDTPVRGGSAIGGMLTRKYAGIPAFVILLVVAGGAYLYIRSRGSGGSYDVTGAPSSSDSGDITDLGSEAGYQASGQPQIVFIPANTNPDSSTHGAGKSPPKHGAGYTGQGAHGYGHGYHGHPPRRIKGGRNRYPVRQPNR